MARKLIEDRYRLEFELPTRFGDMRWESYCVYDKHADAVKHYFALKEKGFSPRIIQRTVLEEIISGEGAE